MKKLLLFLCLFVLLSGMVLAQRFGGGGRRGGGRGWGGGEGWSPEYDTCRTAREIPSHSTGTPEWTNAPGFEQDVFTFARVRCDHIAHGEFWSGGNWYTDFPDSDLNLSYRLQQMTALKVNPDGRVISLTDKELPNYPWIYMVEPGRLLLKDEEVSILRKYLLNGGALMADDFWGEREWAGFQNEIKRVFPDRDFVELPMTHPIFHSVFPLDMPKNQLQTPNIRLGTRSLIPGPYFGVTWEREDAQDMHVRAVLDDKGRILVIATHNCDNGDGWEREGENDGFFHEFSEKRAFPLGINIIFYLMTH